MLLPSASVTLSQDVNASSVSAKLLTVIAPVSLNADAVPYMVGNAGAIYAQNGYCPALDFVSDYITRTRLPVLFVPIAIATPGVVGRFDQSGNTNTSVVSVSVGAYGSLEEVDGQVRVKVGGVVGTDQIVIDLSLDGGYTWKEDIRIGTASTYTIPYIGQILTFAAGSLTAGDTVLTWHSTAPMWNNEGITAARAGLKAQQLKSRAWYLGGEIASSAFAGYVTTQANAYQSSDGRSVVVKAALPDRLPYATLSHDRARMTGTPTITFAEVGVTGDTITRNDGGSFLADGFASGDTIRVTGAATPGNNVVCVPANFAAGVLTLASTDLTAEAGAVGVTITSEPTLTFALNGVSADTITRNRGSWLADGFRVGDVVTITGTASNNVTGTITVLTATVMTFATGTLSSDETIGSYVVTMIAGQTKAQHLAALNATFGSVIGTGSVRLDLGHGRARTLSPTLGFYLRRNANYFDTIRAFQHDIHVATWAVENGAIDGAIIEDATGTIVEHDERLDSGALAAGFTCLRTWAEKPKGAVYVARSVTRAEANTILSATENLYVACLAQSLAQEEAVNCIGKNLVLNADGTATSASLSSITDKINSTLARNLLANREGEGPRASLAYVVLNADDDLSGVDATLNGIVYLKLNGKIAHLNLTVKVS